MEIDNFEIIQLELKYCERCGGLWLRVRGSGNIYCAACTAETADLPGMRRRPAKLRLAQNHRWISRRKEST